MYATPENVTAAYQPLVYAPTQAPVYHAPNPVPVYSQVSSICAPFFFFKPIPVITLQFNVFWMLF